MLIASQTSALCCGDDVTDATPSQILFECFSHDIKEHGRYAVLVATDHDAVDYRELGRLASLIIDTRNACARAGCVGDNVVKA
jgi:UDP-N-acetyl-D-mannosaminuronate dehydrogenase